MSKSKFQSKSLHRLNLDGSKFSSDMNKETPYSILHTYLPFEQINYRSKEYIASVCRDIIEDILKQTYDEENPISLAPLKCSKGSQTERIRCLTVQHNFVQKYILVSTCVIIVVFLTRPLLLKLKTTLFGKMQYWIFF